MNISKLKGVIPDSVIAELPNAIELASLNTKQRLAHFLSQCGHESMMFKATEENLKYSVKGLLAVFPKYFKTEADAKRFEYKPESIANKVYANRMGNGSELSGDGWKFRGRGYIQTTGAANYLLFGNFIGEKLLQNPDLVKTKYPLLSAAFYWKNAKVNVEADKTDNVIGVTKKVNGGTKGLAERKELFEKFMKLIE
jgi:putative chitinase